LQANPHQRSYVLIGAALALPIVVLVVLQVLFAFNRQREDVERDALTRAEQISVLAMARVESDFALMRVLATADPFEQRAWPAAFARAREVAQLNPHWRNVILSDLSAQTEVFSLGRSFSATATPLNQAVAEAAGAEGARIVGGAWRQGPGCPCVYLHTPIEAAGGRLYMLSVALDPAVFRSALMRHAPENAIAAIVDGRGNFIARSRDHDERFGTPATRYVRDAVAAGARSGVYAGTTYEGFRNYTGFYTSNLTGWSTHVALSKNLIDRPRAVSFVAVSMGALAALALAAALIFYALRDLAARRLAEARMAQTQKLEAVGQLTGGVAHDFNNLLTVIIGGLNMLLKRIEDPKQRQIAEHMLEAAQRGDKLTKQLLAFSRGQRLELAPVDLHALKGMEELLRRSIGVDMALHFQLHPTARWVMSDTNQLELAVLNLVINARDAMPDGGRIDISTTPGRKPGTIELRVTDNGMGMPKDVLDRAMEPFFTTKPAGKGTGLGLAQVFGAARQSGGSVEIDSAPGRGTQVSIILPETAPPVQTEPAPEQPQQVSNAPASGQRVLVVDDEAGVRNFMADALRGAGYNAVEAADVGVALRMLEADTPDLLLTDYSMPGMNGLELAERGRAFDPRLRVLIVSGYADADRLGASAVRPALLRKPFDEAELLAAVRAALVGQT